MALDWLSNKSKSQTLPYQTVLLQLEIPRTNEKKELAAEQMFAALHGILRSKSEIRKQGGPQEHISFELASIGKRIRFYVWCPKHLLTFVEGQVYAQYPTVQIKEADEDYAGRQLTQPVIYSTELSLIDNETIPIKTFPSFEVDPLASITATLAELNDENEELWVQVLSRPIADSWHKKSSKYVKRIKEGRAGGIAGGATLSYIGQMAGALFRPPNAEGTAAKPAAPELSERDKARIAAIETKSVKLGYQVKVRIIYAGQDETTARLRMQAMLGTFKQFNTTNLNGFQGVRPQYGRTALEEYRLRSFVGKSFILNIEEVASIFHLPHTNVETPNIVWANTKTAEPPNTLPTALNTKPEDMSLFGSTNFRGHNTPFGIKRIDRSRHLYIIGQTGTGKSGLLELFMLSDIYYNQGLCIIDPHGDTAQAMLRAVPANRMEDVLYFNPADTGFPIGFNPLEVTDPNLKNNTTSELVGVLKRMFESWGPRLEYILRYTILALLDYPGSTMLDITRMLTEKAFRKKVIECIQDPVVRNFWTIEFASWNDKFASEAVAPVLNKVGAFTANPMVRNIIGQPKSTFNIRTLMDEGKILIVNLSRGLLGEDNAAILGSLMVTKVQLAAMSRANIPMDQRRPFYLYVDEFQNFATDSFATILSEARKYALNLTVANQYTSQMTPVVKDAVFGNVGSIVSFRVGADDAGYLVKYFAPFFEDQDLQQMHNRHFLTTMSIGGEKSLGFSGITLNIPQLATDYSSEIIAISRNKYSQTREIVEAAIEENSRPAGSTPAPLPLATPPSSAPTQREQQAQAQQLPQVPGLKPMPQPQNQSISQPQPTDQKLASGPSTSLNPEQINTSGDDKAPKKKRTRSRKKKRLSDPQDVSHENREPIQQNSRPIEQATPQVTTSQPKNSEGTIADDTVIKLR